MGFQLKGVLNLLDPEMYSGKTAVLQRLNKKQTAYFRDRLEEYLNGKSTRLKSICIEYLKSDCEKQAKKKNMAEPMKDVAAILIEFAR